MMKEIARSMKSLLLSLALVSLAAAPAFAGPKKGKERRTRALMKKISRLNTKLQRDVKRLSPSEMSRISRASVADGPAFTDSDKDGLIDLLERALNTEICDSDSDDDGMEDGEEIDEENDPHDEDDSLEVVTTIEDIDNAMLYTGGLDFALSADTEYWNEAEEEDEISVSELSVGDRVLVEAVIEDDGSFSAIEVVLLGDDHEEEKEDEECEHDEEDEDEDDEEDEEDDENDEEEEEDED